MSSKRRIFRKWPQLLAALVVSGLVFTIISYGMVRKGSSAYIYTDAEKMPDMPVALVLGSMVHQDGSLGGVVQERADAAIALYKAGRLRKILISGDHGRKGYDEVNAIRDYMLQQGLPAEDIFMDHAGFDTYSSLYRARDVFQVKKMVIISQAFHLPRAVFIARSLGLDVVALAADGALPRNRTLLKVREFAASAKAFLEAAVFKPKPHFLGPVIPIMSDGRLTEDK